MRRYITLYIALVAIASARVASGQGTPTGGNHSDNGGAGGGGGNHSDNGGGNHSDNGGGNHSDNGGSGDAVVSPEVLAAVTSAQLRVSSALNSGVLDVTQTAAGETSIAAATASVAAVVAGRADADATARLTNALLRSGVRPGDIAALVQSVQGITTAPATTGPDGAPARIMAAGARFNAFVNAASPDFLAEPPAEFLVLRAALLPMVQALRPVAHSM